MPSSHKRTCELIRHIYRSVHFPLLSPGNIVSTCRHCVRAYIGHIACLRNLLSAFSLGCMCIWAYCLLAYTRLPPSTGPYVLVNLPAFDRLSTSHLPACVGQTTRLYTCLLPASMHWTHCLRLPSGVHVKHEGSFIITEER